MNPKFLIAHLDVSPANPVPCPDFQDGDDKHDHQSTPIIYSVFFDRQFLFLPKPIRDKPPLPPPPRRFVLQQVYEAAWEMYSLPWTSPTAIPNS